MSVTWTIHHHDVMAAPWPLDNESVQCIVTSPPYWGLRDYGVEGQLGLERTFDEYVENMVAVFREARRVLRKDGTLWLNLGDCYNAYNGGAGPGSKLSGNQTKARPKLESGYGLRTAGLKPKDLVGIPWRVAFALQADGWWLRSDIVWAKPNPMPESITDRPTRAHEYVFLLTKSARYFYNADAIREPCKTMDVRKPYAPGQVDSRGNGHARREANEYRHNLVRQTSQESANRVWSDPEAMARIVAQGANSRSVWSIATEPYPEAHFATFPKELARRCILAGSRPGDLVLDPFAGSGTTLLVADIHGRHSVGLELNQEYIALAEKRIRAPRSEAEAERLGREEAGQLPIFEKAATP